MLRVPIQKKYMSTKEYIDARSKMLIYKQAFIVTHKIVIIKK